MAVTARSTNFQKLVHTHCLCDLLTVITNTSHTINCNRLNSNSIFVEMIVIRDNSTFAPLNFPFKILKLYTFLALLVNGCFH